jgi:hypothetical protein
LQARREGQRGGRHAERDHVGQRVELAPERGMRLAPARDAAVEHVEDEGGRCQRRGPEKLRERLARHEGHGQEHCADAAGRVAEREGIGQVEAADHREMLANRGAFGRGHKEESWVVWAPGPGNAPHLNPGAGLFL